MNVFKIKLAQMQNKMPNFLVKIESFPVLNLFQLIQIIINDVTAVAGITQFEKC